MLPSIEKIAVEPGTWLTIPFGWRPSTPTLLDRMKTANFSREHWRDLAQLAQEKLGSSFVEESHHSTTSPDRPNGVDEFGRNNP
jgi:hypothetical protein